VILEVSNGIGRHQFALTYERYCLPEPCAAGTCPGTFRALEGSVWTDGGPDRTVHVPKTSPLGLALAASGCGNLGPNVFSVLLMAVGTPGFAVLPIVPHTCILSPFHVLHTANTAVWTLGLPAPGTPIVVSLQVVLMGLGVAATSNSIVANFQ
jgi:hypothetical protein